jgi:predicted transcriptional regulator
VPLSPQDIANMARLHKAMEEIREAQDKVKVLTERIQELQTKRTGAVDGLNRLKTQLRRKLLDVKAIDEDDL